MKRIYSTLLVLICCLSSVDAQSLAKCIEIARTNNIDMRVSDLQVQRAKRMESTYLEMDWTELSLSQDPTSGGSPDNALTLSQKIDFPTVYGRRRKLLKAETQVEESRRQLTESELTRDVSVAYSKLLYWQHVEALLCGNDSVLGEFVRTADIRYKYGETNRLELINAQQMKAENGIRLREAQNKKTTAAIQLQQLMNISEAVVATDDYLCVQPADDAYSFAATPHGQLLESEQMLSESEFEYIRQRMMPSFKVGIRHQLVISGINPYNVDRSRFDKGNWMGFEVGVAFPLCYGSQKARKSAAKLDVDIARTIKEQAELKSGAELLIAKHALESTRRLYDYYQTDGIPAAKEIRRLSRIEYGAGEITYVEHAQNLSAAFTVEMDNAKAIDALNQAIIKLNFIKGK